MNPLFNRRAVLAGLGALPIVGTSAWAQDKWPTKPLRFILPYPAGGTPDGLMRMVAEQLTRLLGEPAIVENSPGASGLIGMRAVSKGQADGHTFAYLSAGQVTLDAMNPKFDLLKELKPVVRMSNSPFVAVVNSSSPIMTMGDLIAAVQAKPGQVPYGTAGRGSPAFMAVEYLADAIKNFRALEVPYKGAVESINAILGEQIDFSILVLGAAVPHIKSGRLRALAVTTSNRVPLLPDVPTVAEATSTKYEFKSWGGLAMHIATPDDIVMQAAMAVTKAMNANPVKALLAANGSVEGLSSSPGAFANQIRTSVAAERVIMQRLGLRQ